jgi:hypothetical protein
MDAKTSGGADLGTNVTLTDRAVRPTPAAFDDTYSVTPEKYRERAARLKADPRFDNGNGAGMRIGTMASEVQAKMWPTPQARDHKDAGGPEPHGRHTPSLGIEASRHHPTTPTDGKPGSPKADLNPRFVAALMGVPWDWLTPCTSVATDSYRQWQHTHSLHSQPEQAYA